MFKFFKKKTINKNKNNLIKGFDEDKYLEANPDVREAIEKGLFKSGLEHLEKYGLEEIKIGKRKFHPEFEPYNEEKYLSMFSDIKEAVEKGIFKSGFEHFCKFGYGEIISGKRFYINYNDIFDKNWYKKAYKDIELAGVDPLLHYLRVGWKEGRDPHPLFQTNVYLQSEPNFREKLLKINSNPLSHYLSIGYLENRPFFFNELIHTFKSYSCSSTPILFDKIETNKNTFKAAVFIHVFYPDIGDLLIKESLQRGLDVYVSFVEGTNYDYLIDKYANKINYKIFENRGRDIAPFLLGFKDELIKYEYALHLHTKKSLHYGKERKDWLDYCLESLLGNIEIVKSIFEKNEEVSIIFPEPPDFIKDQMNWGWNYNRVYKLMEMLGYKIDKYDNLDFPAGSMFWFRVKDLKPIFDLNISLYLFEQENGQVDGTLAHAIERLFGIFVLKEGKKLIPIRYKYTDIFSFEKRINKNKFMIQKNSKSNENYALTYKFFYPELTPLTFTRSKNKNLRLNILLPTINSKHIFGGISTALKFFFQLASRLNCDVRILTTDAQTDIFTMKNYSEFSNYTLDYLCDDDPKYVLSLVPRHLGDVPIRETDIFIATAWWTAYHLKEIENFQKKQYNNNIKHIYFIQDFEPHFYGWSSKHQLAYNTYFRDWIGIYNTELLFNYFKNKKLLLKDNYILKPDLNEKIKKELKKLHNTKKEKIILLYGRPSALRNCNEIILEAIYKFRKDFDKNNEWRIISLGEKYEHSLLNQLNIEILGKVSLEEYATLLSKAFIGISLMISPHPSYPPFEMLAADLYVFTSKYENKNKETLNFSKLTIDYTNEQNIYDFLVEKSLLFNENLFYNSKTIENISFGNGLSMEKIIDKILKFYKKG